MNKIKDHIQDRYFMIIILVFLLVLVLFSIPMFIKQDAKELLKLDIRNPKWWQFVTVAYTNDNIKHYRDNIFVFSIVFILQISLIKNINKNKKYLYLLSSTLILFPLIDSLFKITLFPIFFPNTILSIGSSGIVSAIIGFIPTIWILYMLKLNGRIQLNHNFLFIVLILVVLLLFTVYSKNILLIILFMSILLVLLFTYRKSLIKIYNVLISIKTWRCIYLILILIVFIILVSEAFPRQIMVNNNQIGVITHYLGLIYGVIVSYYFLR